MIRTKILPFIAWVVLSLWSRLLRVGTLGRSAADRLAGEGRSIIYAFWHGSVFLLPYLHRGSDILIMVSESRDGEIVTRMLRRFGFAVVRGSSKRRGSRALIGLISGMRRGRSVAIAVDGPRGPRHEVKEGAIFLAGHLHAPIIPVATGARRSWTLGSSWDRMMIPAPFTEGLVLYGDPIIVSGTFPEEIDSKRAELASALDRLMREAAERVAAPQVGTRPLAGKGSRPARSS